MMTRRTDSASHFSPRLITEKVYRLLKRGKDQVRCYNCKRTLKVGDSYFVTSQHKIYCSECWEKIHFDLPEVSDLVWEYDKDRDTWILVTKGEKEVQDSNGRGTK